VDVDGGGEEVGLEDTGEEVVSDRLVVKVLGEQVEHLQTMTGEKRVSERSSKHS
jgi:hypothetical protein